MQQSQENLSPQLMQQVSQTNNLSPPFMQQGQQNLTPPLLISNNHMQQVGGFMPSVSPPCFVTALPSSVPCLPLVSYNSMPIMMPNSNPSMPAMHSMGPMWTPEQIPHIPVMTSFKMPADGSHLLVSAVSERTPTPQFSRSVSVGSEGSMTALPQTWFAPQARSRRGSMCSNPCPEGIPLQPMIDYSNCSNNWSSSCQGDYVAMDTILPTITPDHTPSVSPNRGQKQDLITSVRQQCHEVLSNHFPFLKEGNIMSVHTQHELQELDELKDVLRGNNVGNIRAKSLPSLSVLVDFLKHILADKTISVKRVDVILQKKKTNHLKGLLVNVEFGSQAELVHVRDAIWMPKFKDQLPKFMPALFAQDCSWIGRRPTDLKYLVDARGDIRVQGPLPENLKALNLKEGCRVKSMTVIFKHGKKNKPHEVAPREFLNVLQGRRFKTKNGMRTLSEKTDVTISFEEDWKTNFWRLPA